MQFHILDTAVLVAFFALVLGTSLYKSRREKTSEDYFLAGRGLKWYLIGFSIVAANISTEQFVGMAGQSAGDIGLAVSSWQLVGSVGIVIIAFTLLPRFLKAGIYTIPEYLEYRYNSLARTIMAIITVIMYIAVLLAGVLYSGGLTLKTVFGVPLVKGIWMIGLITATYTVWGGLKAVAWADLFQGGGLLLGGIMIFFLGLHACGGWGNFYQANADKLHMVLPSTHPGLPWTGVSSGMWIVLVYYCGLNQFIVQRNLAAKTLRDGQLGVIFAGALWLLVPFAIVIPGIMSHHLYHGQMKTTDEAFPLLIRNLVPMGLRGFMFAAITGAVISSLASMLNSASTIVTMDIYRRLINPRASQKGLIMMGRVLTMIFIVAGCFLAPMLSNPDFGGVFQYIQQFQGYIWPGVVAAFLFGMMVPTAPGSAGVAALIAGPILYGIFQYFAPELHFLIQVAVVFQLVIMIMILITFFRPLETPRTLPVREDIIIQTGIEAKILGGLVIAGVIGFYVLFW